MTSPTKLPFAEHGAPVCTTLAELRELMERYQDQRFCLFVGNRSAERWQQSRGRLYMNRALPGLVYVPVSLAAGEVPALYDLVQRKAQIVAVNHTDGYKNNETLRDMLEMEADDPLKVDFIVRDQARGWDAFNLNSRAFMQFCNTEIGELSGRTVLLAGVGGFGEAIVPELLEAGVARLLLVDSVSKQALVERVQGADRASYHEVLSPELVDGLSDVIVINATGLKEISDFPELAQLIGEVRDRGFVYIDLYPFADLEFVALAREYGWQAFNTKEMQNRNDFQMLELIAEFMGRSDIEFSDFVQEVELARQELEGS